jgi:hypothetical protein
MRYITYIYYNLFGTFCDYLSPLPLPDTSNDFGVGPEVCEPYLTQSSGSEGLGWRSAKGL